MNTMSSSVIMEGYNSRKRRYIITVSLLGVIVFLLAGFMMMYGKTIYSPVDIFKILFSDGSAAGSFTVKTLRLPRMLAAVLCGFAFGAAGNVFQKLLGNPLASPDIIGVSSGASVAAIFGILIFRLDGTVVSLIAVLCGIVVSALIYIIANGNGYSDSKLILTGIGMNAFLNAIISWLLLKASEYDVASALRWMSGSLNNVTLDQIPKLAIVVIGASIAIAVLAGHLKVMELGDSYATVLGVRLSAVRISLIVLAVLMIAFATAVTGPIAAVAFLSGPIASRLSGSGQGNMLPSGLVGASLVLASDMVGQYAFPSRYPVGIITGILGAPYLIFLLFKMNKRG